MSKLDSILEYGLGGEKLLIPKAKQEVKILMLKLAQDAYDKQRPEDSADDLMGRITDSLEAL